MSPPLPVRPRLAEHARVRRHVVDGKEIVVVHHGVTGDMVRMGPREWDLVAGADGTRDKDAIVLDAARRGALRRTSEIAAVLEVLHASALLADGIEPPSLPDPSDPSRPLDVLPRFSLTCDGSGGCCGMYASVVFTPLEAARARALRPEVLGCGEGQERAFTPEQGSGGPGGSLSAALVDGRCAFLDGDGRCSLHRLGGEAAKPRACSVYPASFVDDGESVRVSVGVECTCVLASAGRPGGSPLVDPLALTRKDIGPGARVVVLPPEIPLSRGGDRADRSAFVAWSRSIALRMPDERSPGVADLAAILWSLAAAVEDHGLDDAAMARALSTPRRPEARDLAPWIAALAARAEARVESAGAWRSPRDLSRVASKWIAVAARTLEDPRALDAALAASTGFRRDEAFGARAIVHGHHLVNGLPLATALRDRAVRFVVARALPGSIPAREAFRAHPLALLEAVMRGHGLGAYAAEVPGATRGG